MWRLFWPCEHVGLCKRNFIYATLNKISEILVRIFLYCTYIDRLQTSQRECLFVYVLTKFTKILLLLIFKEVLFVFYSMYVGG